MQEAWVLGSRKRRVTGPGPGTRSPWTQGPTGATRLSHSRRPGRHLYAFHDDGISLNLLEVMREGRRVGRR